jgi:ubiquinone/menaquinone biosynthesis C-methylase UbiE
MLDINRIDEFLAELEKAKDDDELRHIFATYSAKYDLDVPKDPYGDAYRKQQFDLYESLAQKKYRPENEVTKFDVESASISPFPYCHGSYDTVGNQLMAIGFVIKALALPKGAKILEFGPGWGNTTIALAKMGYEVTAVDIENNFCRLIEQRSALEKINIKVINADFNYIKSLNEKFDAILYFECFHHADNHLDLMGEFDRILNPGGRICFGAEPITPNFPLPWGLRMDGESLWAIRKNGWLELGFNQTYFEDAMARFGWVLTFNKGEDSPWSSAIVAKRKTEVCEYYSTRDGALKTEVGKIKDGYIVSTGVAGYLVFGPYATLPKGLWRAQFIVDENTQKYGKIFLDVVCEDGLQQLATKEIKLTNQTINFSIDFQLPDSKRMIEVRVLVNKETSIGINNLKLSLN